MMTDQMPQPGPDRRGNGPAFLTFWRRPAFWKWLVLLSAFASLFALSAAYLYIRSLDISKLNDPLPEPTLILDRFGKPASQLSASRIKPVPLSQIPPDLIQAVLAVEDKRFYKHRGIDLRSIGRAAVRDLYHGGYTEGASTITQQLARNLFLKADKTLARKLKEAAYAIKIEMTYSKDEILEIYLNSIYLGEGSWGVEGAAEKYFGKKVQDLNLPEAALIAALPKAPSKYSPLKDEALALARRNHVLQLMLQQGKISEREFQKAAASPLGVAKGSTGNDLNGRYPDYIDAVIAEAIQQYGFTEEQLLTGGLRISTELDPTVQKAVSDVYGNNALFPDRSKDQLIQSGAVVIDQQTGGIRALSGGRGEGVFRGFNRATQLRRQPGSSFKPIAVYGPALELGYSPNTRLYDGPLNINGYQPKDWDGRTRGEVRLWEAIVHSWNVPAVWLLNEIGIDSGLSFAAKLGIKLPKEDRKLGIALGGLSKGVSPLQMAQAFSAFADQGVLHPAHTITRIATASGYLLIEAKQRPVQVMAPRTAYWMTAMLQDAVAEGTGRNAAMNRPVAGKSGTTQLPNTPMFAGVTGSVAKDAWFVGYTPELTAAVWAGYDHTDRSHYLTTSGGSLPAALFREMMTRALADVPVSAFPPPPPDLESW